MDVDAAVGKVWAAMPRNSMLILATGVGDSPRWGEEEEWREPSAGFFLNTYTRRSPAINFLFQKKITDGCVHNTFRNSFIVKICNL